MTFRPRTLIIIALFNLLALGNTKCDLVTDFLTYFMDFGQSNFSEIDFLFYLNLPEDFFWVNSLMVL